MPLPSCTHTHLSLLAPFWVFFTVSVYSAQAEVTVKLDVLVAVPPGVVPLIVPVVALARTVAVICVALTTVNVDAAGPLKPTAVTPVKFVPVRVTLVAPAVPVVGEKLWSSVMWPAGRRSR